MIKAAPAKSVLDTILEWSLTRPLWQRDALRRIVAEGMPDAVSLAELVDLCRKEHGAGNIGISPEPLAAVHLPAVSPRGASVALHELRDVVGVNQLAPAQTLSFEARGLTIVYGHNGAGKSGYARVLKRACRARRAGTIMPDAYRPAPAGKAAATLSISKDGAVQPDIPWLDDNDPNPDLSAVSVFDRECGAIHVQEKNEVAFRPFGLDIPDDLAAVCQHIKETLTAEQTHNTAVRDPVFAKPTWSPQTAVGKIMSGLTRTTNLDALEALAGLSEVEAARLAQLQSDLSGDPTAASLTQQLFADGIRQFAGSLERLQKAFGDDAIDNLLKLHVAATGARTAATLAADAAFKGLPVAGVGGATWQALWEAARRFSEHAAYPGQDFPPDHQVDCVLCQQPLAEEARARMSGFEAFLQADTERQAVAAETALKAARRAFEGTRVDIRAAGQVRRRLALSASGVAQRALRAAASARLRRWQTLKTLDGEKCALNPLVEAPVAEINQIAGEMSAYATQLAKAADIAGRKVLEQERNELQDRANGKDLLAVARREVERLDQAHILSACIQDTATNAITKLGNDIADTVITLAMRDRFQSEIVRLAADRVRVEIVRSGGKFGSPHYQVKLFANHDAKLALVLSEGEQTCVALAAFLADLATASHVSGLVFDDPVTSLDHRWRRKVAERLVAEAAVRQIIVFTHDMVFANDLSDLARNIVPLRIHSLSRTVAGTGVVADGLPWQQASIKDRIDKMQKAIRAAKTHYDAHEEDQYATAALHVYSWLRATWERALEDVAFGGVILRHRDYINTSHLKSVTVLEPADVEAFEKHIKKCHDLVDAHDPSRGRQAAVPAPDEVLQDIQYLNDWVDSLRARQKATA